MTVPNGPASPFEAEDYSMKFYFTSWNHNPRAREPVLDVVFPLIAGLRDLGYEVDIGDGPPREDSINVLVEFFRNRRTVSQLLGKNFVIVATEFHDGGGFNRERSKSWMRRYNYFKFLAKEARAIWVVCDDAVDGYQKFGPAVQLALGWSPQLMSHTKKDVPKYDLCMYGNMAVPARVEIVKKLSIRLKVVAMDFETKAHRDNLLRQARFCYGFRPHANVVNASTTRIVSSLMQGVPVLQERVVKPSSLVEAMETIDGVDDLLERWEEISARREEILNMQIGAWQTLSAAEIMRRAVSAMRPPVRPSWASRGPLPYLRALLAKHVEQ